MFVLNGVVPDNLEVFSSGDPVVLSVRQQQVLDLIAVGDSYKMIGYKLGISINTVAYHVSVIKAKLNCANSRGIIPAALRAGISFNDAY